METTRGKWERRRSGQAEGRRAASGRRRGKKVALGPREQRRLLQLVVCVALFLVVFFGKGVFPERLAQVREQILDTLQADTDFRAAFASLGQSISQGEPVLDTLGNLWVDVFGGEAITVYGGETRTQSPLYQAEAAFLSGYPTAEEPVSHWLTELGADPAELAAGQEAEPTSESEETAESTLSAEPVMEHVEYTGPDLPENTTMDWYNLSAVGVGETVSPVLGWVSSSFGWREHPVDGGEKFHYGVDLAVNEGTDIAAFADGTVDYIGDSPIYGLYLQISHAGGVQTFYAHCSELLVQQGQTVTVGQVVAKSGSTGNATGPHLHFEIKLNGVRLNPVYYIETTG